MSDVVSGQTVLALMGPTGSGKTDLVVRLDPRRYEVVSCDSRQVYQELDIGAATPTAKELAAIPHHLVQFLTPDRKIDVGLYIKMARAAITDIFERGRQPIIVGGTGFYYRALKTGLFEVQVPDAIRDRVEAMPHSERLERLRELDERVLLPTDAGLHPRAGHIHPNDRYRVQRALEVSLTTGKPWSNLWREVQNGANLAAAPWHFHGWRLEMPRDEYFERLHVRAERMVQAGFVSEARAIFAKYGMCPGLKTLGYREALAALQTELSDEELIANLTIAHRQYGKRQRTWFRRESELVAIQTADFARVVKYFEQTGQVIGSDLPA